MAHHLQEIWGGGEAAGLEVDGSIVRVVNSRGRTHWERDFSPRTVYRAFMQPCIPPLEANRSNVPIHHMVNVVLASSREMDARTQASLGSTQWDGQMLRFSAAGSLRSSHPLSFFIQAGEYGFIPRGYVVRFQERDLNGDGIKEALFSLVHGRGMFPGALVLVANGRITTISSPGHISDWTVTPGEARNWRFTLWGVANRMCHLKYVTRMELRETGQVTINSSLIPHLNKERENRGMRYSQLTFLPKDISPERGKSLPDHGAVKFFRSSGDTLRVDENGTLTVGVRGRERVYRDARERLDAVYGDIHFGLQARDLRNDLEASARFLDRAADAGVENPFLRSAILYHRGDVAVRRGRYPEGRRWLTQARELHPENSDAAQRMCEIVLLESGPRAALRMVDEGGLRKHLFWGLMHGRDFFRALCLLQAGDFTSARLFSDRMEQGDLRDARLVRALIGLFSGKRTADALPLDNNEMSLLYTWEEYRLLEGRARLLEADDPERGAFCFRDVYEHSDIRRHLASMSRAWYALKAGRSGDAGRMAKIAFKDLRTRARGDLETWIWWFYDAWVYGRIMEELKEEKEARRGFSACVEANPHTDLARRANLRLSGLTDR